MKIIFSCHADETRICSWPRFEIEGFGDSAVTYWLSPGLGRGRPGFDTRLNLHKGATKGLKKTEEKVLFLFLHLQVVI